MEILWHEFWSPSHSHPGPQSLGCAQIVAWLLKLVICKKNFHIHVYIGIQSCRSTLSAFLYLLFILKILALFPLCCTASTIWWARSWSKSPLSIESLYFTGIFASIQLHIFVLEKTNCDKIRSLGGKFQCSEIIWFLHVMHLVLWWNEYLMPRSDFLSRRAGSKSKTERGIFVKHFKNIPMADMEIVLVSLCSWLQIF